MKAQRVQCRATFGARGSGTDDWHGQPGSSHGAVLGVREAKGGLRRHGREEDCRTWDGEVSPEAALGLKYVVGDPGQALFVYGPVSYTHLRAHETSAHL
eukprot:5439899-Alexandrium_andersonii.AAC.1